MTTTLLVCRVLDWASFAGHRVVATGHCGTARLAATVPGRATTATPHLPNIDLVYLLDGAHYKTDHLHSLTAPWMFLFSSNERGAEPAVPAANIGSGSGRSS